MSTPYFPPITNESVTPFRVIRELMKKNPKLLEDENCPYPPGVKDFLKELAVGSPGMPSPEEFDVIDLDLDDPDALLKEFEKLYQNLNRIQKGFVGLDAKDRVQWAKAATGLLEKIVSLKERTFSLRNHSAFQRKVLELLDIVLTPEQRTEYVQKLGEFIENNKKSSEKAL